MKKLVLAILDGFGFVEDKDTKIKSFQGSLLGASKSINFKPYEGEIRSGDAVKKSSCDKFKEFFKNNPYTLLHASGQYVGLPVGQMGNSEVGHLNIGAGKIVLQDLLRISEAFKTNKILDNYNFISYLKLAKGQKAHIIGLISNGNVHSSIEHLKSIMKIAKKYKVQLYIHMITDGRDTKITSGIDFAKEIVDYAKKCNCIIASISGRYFAMDREKNYDRTQLYFDCILGKNESISADALEYIQTSYNNKITDEFIKPNLFNEKYAINNNDKVLLFNFRADRVRQITKLLLDKTDCEVYTMTEYNKDFKNAKVLFEPSYVKNVLSEYISKKGLKQLKVAEVSKYAHVTYFLNGGNEMPFANEDRELVDMVDVPTFDLAPEMSAKKVSDKVINGMALGYDFICVNYANCDMVGHTGVYDAACKAVETVTNEVVRLYEKAQKEGYILVVTADHGNAECMIKDNFVCTTHTTNRVPLLILNSDEEIKLKDNGSLCNIMPTILELMKI